MPPVSMDFFKAPLNPCSIESIPEPLTLSDGSRIWPVMLACYELQEDNNRHGQLDLFAIRVPNMNSKEITSSMVLRFGTPTKVLTPTESKKSGILDGKWIRLQEQSTSPTFYFASAHSSGEIGVHSCSVSSSDDNHGSYPQEEDDNNSFSPFDIQKIGQSESLAKSDNKQAPPLCLSLNWESDSFGESSRIVSSYSDGRVAIHNVELLRETGKLQLIESESWDAHALFTNPSEVWSAGFVGEGPYIMSGGDDATLKLWDLRSTTRPMQVLKHFEAGVTVIAPHPRQPNVVACGSYDETICLYDIRYLSPKKPLGHSGPLGGGIWRIKWHPYDDNRMLVAAMHGGCRIVQIDSTEETAVLTATKEFTEHKSMAYGADWLVCNHPDEEEGYFEAAASCSFYDRAVHLWDTVA